MIHEKNEKTNPTIKHGGDDRKPNHSHAWRGTWNRPLHIDEDTQHPFTIARMTNHSVRGSDL